MSQKKVTYEVTIRAVIEARSPSAAKEEVHKRLRDMWDSLPWPGKWVGYLVDEKVTNTSPEPEKKEQCRTAISDPLRD